ncbi:MAG: class II aldolase/adducin family protein [Bacteroidota bacterium]
MNREKLDSFIHWARESGKLGLVCCSSGNLSHRIDDDTMLISSTGSWLPELTADQVSLMAISLDEIHNAVKPSGEFRLHREIYRTRGDIDTILHFQSPSATTLACMDIRPDYNVIIEVPVYIGNVAYLPFLQPGSEELAKEAGVMMAEASLLQMANHGQVVCGKGFRDTIQKAVFFELACSIILKSNFKAIPVGGDQLALLRNYSVKNY